MGSENTEECAMLTKDKAERSRPRADESNKNTCGENIARLREERNMSRADLAGAMGITLGGVSAWEYGRTRPDIDSIKKLCAIFSVSSDEIIGVESGIAHIGKSEKELLERYLNLPATERTYVSKMIDVMLAAHISPAPVIRKVRQQLISIPVNALSMCAGSGVDLSDQGEGETMSLVDMPILHECDEIVRISGRSMEPAFFDGDLALVRHCDRVEEGETGVFVIDGEGMIKQYFADGLHPLNPAYDIIRPSEYNSVRCFGKVIGKVTDDMLPPKTGKRRGADA